ncbi:hypothetical protein EYR40_001961 [Pleurotus pulmonarius]|nr:hypothetical protein EYR40_001961 [Pleurotus pulmonarius]
MSHASRSELTVTGLHVPEDVFLVNVLPFAEASKNMPGKVPRLRPFTRPNSGILGFDASRATATQSFASQRATMVNSFFTFALMPAFCALLAAGGPVSKAPASTYKPPKSSSRPVSSRRVSSRGIGSEEFTSTAIASSPSDLPGSSFSEYFPSASSDIPFPSGSDYPSFPSGGIPSSSVYTSYIPSPSGGSSDGPSASYVFSSAVPEYSNFPGSDGASYSDYPSSVAAGSSFASASYVYSSGVPEYSDFPSSAVYSSDTPVFTSVGAFGSYSGFPSSVDPGHSTGFPGASDVNSSDVPIATGASSGINSSDIPIATSASEINSSNIPFPTSAGASEINGSDIPFPTSAGASEINSSEIPIATSAI